MEMTDEGHFSLRINQDELFESITKLTLMVERLHLAPTDFELIALIRKIEIAFAEYEARSKK